MFDLCQCDNNCMLIHMHNLDFINLGFGHVKRFCDKRQTVVSEFI